VYLKYFYILWRNKLEEFKDFFKNFSGGKVLDVGTGVGEFVGIIKECFGNYDSIVGIDSSAKAIAAASKTYNEDNINFIAMDAGRMEFPDRYFDTVCLSNTLHHLPDINAVLSEMKRVLKPEGTFVIMEMYQDNQNDSQMSHVYFHHLAAEIDNLLGKTHNATFKRDGILKIAKTLEMPVYDTLDYNDPEYEDSEDKLIKLGDKLLKRVEDIKSFEQYEEFLDRAKHIKEWMIKNKFAGATELIIVMKNN
jgi:ubiquinone/menaquinone biosynthesis C-methylase UbiE